MSDQNAAGALASQQLQVLVDQSVIQIAAPLQEDQIQPASIDLRLGKEAYRVRASFLPGEGKTVEDCIQQFGMHKVDLQNGAVLEKDCVYIVPLLESLDLPKDYIASGNPKSSTGRLDVFTRLITDNGIEFDQVPRGYQGKLYAEVAPLTFSILVRTGSRLSQLRIRQGQSSLTDQEHIDLHAAKVLVDGTLNGNQVKRGVPLSVDLSGSGDDGLVGYRAKRHSAVIDVDKKAACNVSEFWDPVYANQDRQLILDPGEFYILVSKEAVHIPIDHAAEMVPYDTLVGEFRVHYAGFFDPGFGAPEAGGIGSKAVLEVRCFDVPFILEDGQNIGRLVYERMLETPDSVYGQGLASNYQAQGLKLSKHFKLD
jgi:dCTP deaminase